MNLLITMFGVLILMAGTVIVISPEILSGYLRKNKDKLSLHVAAVAIRLMIGLLLVTQAGVSKYPLVIEILGWLSMIAALILAVMGKRHFKRLMSWALSLSNPFGRVGGVFAVILGAFLIDAFI